jgi:hypothetical protein
MRRAITALAITLLTAGCSSSQPARHLTPSEQIGAWADGGGKQHLDTLNADNQKISNDSGNSNAMGNDCLQLRADVKSARGYAKLPDAAAQQHWTATLNNLDASASECTEAASSGSSDLWAKAASSSDVAHTEMQATQDRLAAIVNGHT